MSGIGVVESELADFMESTLAASLFELHAAKTAMEAKTKIFFITVVFNFKINSYRGDGKGFTIVTDQQTLKILTKLKQNKKNLN